MTHAHAEAGKNIKIVMVPKKSASARKNEGRLKTARPGPALTRPIEKSCTNVGRWSWTRIG